MLIVLDVDENKRRKILVADDDRFIRDDLKDLLEVDYNLLFSASAIKRHAVFQQRDRQGHRVYDNPFKIDNTLFGIAATA